MAASETATAATSGVVGCVPVTNVGWWNHLSIDPRCRCACRAWYARPPGHVAAACNAPNCSFSTEHWPMLPEAHAALAEARRVLTLGSELLAAAASSAGGIWARVFASADARMALVSIDWVDASCAVRARADACACPTAELKGMKPVSALIMEK